MTGDGLTLAGIPGQAAAAAPHLFQYLLAIEKPTRTGREVHNSQGILAFTVRLVIGHAVRSAVLTPKSNMSDGLVIWPAHHFRF